MMNNIESREYSRLRAKGWAAKEAFHAARAAREWFDAEWDGRYEPDEPGIVRLSVEWDRDTDLSHLDDRAVYTEQQASAEYERAERNGTWGIIGEFWNGEEWQHVDSIWGFIGDDWKDSGYDVDVKRATLDAAREFVNSRLLQGAV